MIWCGVQAVVELMFRARNGHSWIGVGTPVCCGDKQQKFADQML
jgi:hypothetical protein